MGVRACVCVCATCIVIAMAAELHTARSFYSEMSNE